MCLVEKILCYKDKNGIAFALFVYPLWISIQNGTSIPARCPCCRITPLINSNGTLRKAVCVNILLTLGPDLENQGVASECLTHTLVKVPSSSAVIHGEGKIQAV